MSRLSWTRRLSRTPEWLWSPLMVGGLLLLVGLLSAKLHHPWLFPSLGPTAFIQAHRPRSDGARFYNTIIGHLLGIAAGYACVLLLSFANPPSMAASDHALLARVYASTLAVMLTMLGQVLLRAYHPPAAATTLIISLGLVHMTWRDASGLATGILIVACAGELLRRLRVAEPTRPAPITE